MAEEMAEDVDEKQEGKGKPRCKYFLEPCRAANNAYVQKAAKK